MHLEKIAKFGNFAHKSYIMANFILADNQDLTRFAFEKLIQQKEDNVIRWASNKKELVLMLQEDENSVVVLDYTLFDIADEEQLLIISERFNMASWVLISEDLTEKFIRHIIYSSNAFSVVFKDDTIKCIHEALQSAALGKRYISQRALEILITQKQEEAEPAVLTATEKEIVRAIAQGKTTKEIANERFSSVHTITTHRKNIFRKLNINTAHEVVKYALRAGLVDTSEFYC